MLTLCYYCPYLVYINTYKNEVYTTQEVHHLVRKTNYANMQKSYKHRKNIWTNKNVGTIKAP
jgi:hypothetical protein